MTSVRDIKGSIDAMTAEYPSLRFSAYRGGGRWIGRVQPIQSSEGIWELLDDLASDRPVVVQGDRVEHRPNCHATHHRPTWMGKVRDLERIFEIEILYSGGAQIPRGYVLSPSIPPHKRRHMWGDSAMCAFLASEGHWVANRNTVADVVPYFLLWLVKWMVYDDCSVWIGREHRSDPSYHCQRVGRNDQCWCGSGIKYKWCHYRHDARPQLRHRFI